MGIQFSPGSPLDPERFAAPKTSHTPKTGGLEKPPSPQPEAKKAISNDLSPKDSTSQSTHREFVFEQKAEVSFASPVKSVASVQSISPLQSLELSDPIDLETAALFSDLGMDSFSQGAFKDAIDFFSEAFNAEPSPKIAYNLGCCFQELGNMDQALEWFEQAQTQAPVTMQMELANKIENRLLR